MHGFAQPNSSQHGASRLSNTYTGETMHPWIETSDIADSKRFWKQRTFCMPPSSSMQSSFA